MTTTNDSHPFAGTKYFQVSLDNGDIQPFVGDNPQIDNPSVNDQGYYGPVRILGAHDLAKAIVELQTFRQVHAANGVNLPILMRFAPLTEKIVPFVERSWPAMEVILDHVVTELEQAVESGELKSQLAGVGGDKTDDPFEVADEDNPFKQKPFAAAASGEAGDDRKSEADKLLDGIDKSGTGVAADHE
jgi:hypothetical protein